MPDRALVMVTRVDLIGEVEAEPIIVDREPDGGVDLTLDDGVLLQLDPDNARALGLALLGDEAAHAASAIEKAA